MAVHGNLGTVNQKKMGKLSTPAKFQGTQSCYISDSAPICH